MRRTGSRDAHAALYDRMLAVERIEAAVATAACLPFPFTLTARAECYLSGHPNPFEESVARAASYRDAGADCLYVPGITDAATIGSLVKEVDAPVNVVMALAGSPMSMNQLEDLGVKRVSIGGSLARATFGLIRRAAGEIRDHGTFTFSEESGAGRRTLSVLCQPAGVVNTVTRGTRSCGY